MLSAAWERGTGSLPAATPVASRSCSLRSRAARATASP